MIHTLNGLIPVLVRSTQDRIAVVDGKGGILFVNQAWSEAHSTPTEPPGLTASVGDNLLDILDRAAGDSFASDMSTTIRRIFQGSQDAAEWPIPNGDQPAGWLSLCRLPLEPACLLVSLRSDAWAPTATPSPLDGIANTSEGSTGRDPVDVAGSTMERFDLPSLQVDALESLVYGVLIIDDSHRIIWANTAACQLTGYSQQELVGSHPAMLKSSMHPPTVYHDLWQTLQEKRVWHGELISRRKDGSFFNLELTITSIFSESGQPEYYIAVQQDISLRIASEIQLRRKLDELAAIHEITLASVGSTSIDDLIARTTRIIARMLYPDQVGVMLRQENEQVLQVHPSYWGIPDELHMVTLPVGAGSICGLVAATGEPVLLEDVRENDQYFKAGGAMCSEVCVPLKVGSEIIGVLNVESAQLNAFLESDLRLLESLAGQLASGIVRLRTEQHERQQRLFAETLSELTAVLNSSLNFEEILDTILEQVGKLVPFEAANIMLFDNDIAQVVRQRGYERFGISEWLQQVRLRIDEFSNVQELTRTLIPCLTTDTKKSIQWVRYPQLEWVRSQITIPIIKSHAAVGVINLDHSVPDFFNVNHVNYLRAFADHVAIALNNSSLFEDSQRRLAELEAVNKVSTALRTARTLDEMLPRLLDEALATLATDAGSISIYRPETGTLHPAVTVGWFGQLYSRDAHEGEGIAWHVFKTGVPYVTREFLKDERTFVNSRPMVPDGWGGACLPIRTSAETVGVLFVAVRLPREIRETEIRLLTTLSEIAGNAIHRSRLHEQTEQRLDRLTALRSVDAAISSSLDLRFTLSVLLDRLISHLDVDAADVLLYNANTQLLEYSAGQGFRTGAIAKSRLRLGEDTAGRSALDRRSVIMPSIAEAAPPFSRALLLASEGFRSYACIPLIAKGQIKGVLEVFLRKFLDPEPEWIDFLETLGGQAAIAIDNANLFNDLQRSNLELTLAYDTTLEGWARALELRDQETEGHSRRVTEMTLSLARSMGLSESEVVHIRRGALLHDIGKMGIPDVILSKNGPLTDEEWSIMRRHPVLAYEWLSPIAHLNQAISIPYCHHEKWDGSGYPRGLRGDQIPLSARIFAVVDVWDALLSDRPYRPAWPASKVRQYIIEQSGIHFDPQVVDHFLSIWQIEER